MAMLLLRQQQRHDWVQSLGRGVPSGAALLAASIQAVGKLGSASGGAGPCSTAAASSPTYAQMQVGCTCSCEFSAWCVHALT
jgi:hypothetical protein